MNKQVKEIPHFPTLMTSVKCVFPLYRLRPLPTELSPSKLRRIARETATSLQTVVYLAFDPVRCIRFDQKGNEKPYPIVPRGFLSYRKPNWNSDNDT